MSGQRTKETVFPLLLEERSAGKELIVMITRNIVLPLEMKSPLAKNLDVVRMFDMDDRTSLEKIRIEAGDVYEHAESATVLVITSENGLRIKGVINGNISISYDDVHEQKDGGPVPHFLDIIHPTSSVTSANDTSDDWSLYHMKNLYGPLRERSDIPTNEQNEKVQKGPSKITVETEVVLTTSYVEAFKKKVSHGLKDVIDYLQVVFALVNHIFKSFDADVLDLQLLITRVILLSLPPYSGLEAYLDHQKLARHAVQKST
ncbi:uncharacterized protein LOC125759494 [Rhipicephalus sanguineus]|uniref:uncharacterized protein LOC125759494 n=1 Tax=Rhipicephalus sanguineus TaxID=34632 RepID=UPI0020C41BD0|nr:uncharacterized protein LOC125759494 [Rhipicephalus sanguineus]